MKRIVIIPLLLSTLYGEDVVLDDGWKVSGQLNAYLQNINVVGGKDTTGRDGMTHNEALNLNASTHLNNGETGVNLRVRGTNDARIQKDGAEVLYFRSFYKDKRWNLEAGDVAASLNPYVFSGTLKGAKAEYRSQKKSHTLNYAVIGGLLKPAWRDFYSEDDTERPTAYATALAVQYLHDRAQELRFNAAVYKDDIATGGSATVTDGKEGYSLGLDGKWRFNKYMTLKGYCAYNYGTKDLRHDIAYHGSSAVTLKFLTRPILKLMKSNFTYQRISAKYISLGGIGASDKEQLENSTLYRISKTLKARLDLKARRDNVDNDDLNETQHIYYEKLGLTYYPTFIKRTTLNFRVSNKDVKGRGADNSAIVAGVDMTIRRRDGWRYGLGYEYQDSINRDINASGLSATTNNVYLLAGYKQRLSEVRSYRFTCRVNYRLISNAQDTVGLKIDAGYQHNKQLSADLLYLLNNTNHEVANNTQNSTYQARAAYKLDEKGRNVVRLLLEKRDVNVESLSTSSYDEYIEKLSLVMNF